MFTIFSVLLFSSTVLSSYAVGTGNNIKNTSQSLKNNEFFPNGLPFPLPKYDSNETKLNQLKFSSHIDFKDQFYVNHEDTNIVSIVNTTTNTVTKKIFVSGGMFKSEGNTFGNDNQVITLA